VTAAQLRDLCLSFAGAEETFPFGPRTSVFKVAGKMFALSPLGAASPAVSLKCEPELAAALRETHAAVSPGYHLDKRHWNTVTLDGSLPDEMPAGGPLLIEGDLELDGRRETRAALCRCGQSANQPYCDRGGPCRDWSYEADG
jgi:predicted DNA-binding protein (MmcQ/YjbR family)